MESIGAEKRRESVFVGGGSRPRTYLQQKYPISLDMNPIGFFYCVLANPTMLGQNVRPKLNPYFQLC